jgi:hypothetical protein
MGRRRTQALKRAARARVPAPRNPVAIAAKKRAAGPHGPGTKAIRQQEKRKLKKLLEQI